MFQATNLFLLIVLLGVVMISAIGGPMIQKVEMFQAQAPVCNVCKQKEQCTCYQAGATSSTQPQTQPAPVATSSAEMVANSQMGKYPMPFWREIVEKEREQSKHIDDIRKVLSSTIKTLKEEDVLPAGSACGCTDLPKVDPLTGMVEESDGCRPPGWLRMMNSRNAEETDGTCK